MCVHVRVRVCMCVCVCVCAVIGEDDEEEEEKANEVINIRELDDVLIKDVGNKIASSGRYVSAEKIQVRLPCQVNLLFVIVKNGYL